MTQTALYRLVNLALGGELESNLRMWNRAGLSKRAAAALLREALGGIEISPDTVRRWMTAVTNGGEGAAA